MVLSLLIDIGLWKALDRTEHRPGDLNLKELLDQVEDYRIQRLFDTK